MFGFGFTVFRVKGCGLGFGLTVFLISGFRVHVFRVLLFFGLGRIPTVESLGLDVILDRRLRGSGLSGLGIGCPFDGFRALISKMCTCEKSHKS